MNEKEITFQNKSTKRYTTLKVVNVTLLAVMVFSLILLLVKMLGLSDFNAESLGDALGMGIGVAILIVVSIVIGGIFGVISLIVSVVGLLLSIKNGNKRANVITFAIFCALPILLGASYVLIIKYAI